MNESSKALFASIAAFVLWGLFPVYWKLFPEVQGYALFIYRLMWSFITLWILLPFLKKAPLLEEILRDNRKWWLTLAALLISSNWLIYMVAVTQGHILEASMGYFLNPLLNLLVGWLFLKERLRSWQMPAVVLAFVGVVWMGASAGIAHFPWIAISLSLTFALYGVIRKLTHVGALEGLTFETSVVFLPFMAWFFLSGGDVKSDMTHLGVGKIILLSLSGIITCTPLLLFTYATRRLSLQVLSFTQYLSPSLKFLCGWWLFNEPLSESRMAGFVFIWIGLAWYSFEQIWHGRAKRKLKDAPAPEL